MAISKSLDKAVRSARKKSRLIIGLMSGTSMDGLDVALCKISGSGLNTKLSLLKFVTVPYTPETKSRIGAVFAKPQVDFVKLSNLNAWIGRLHASIVLDCLKKWKVKPATIDAIASHGQTVMHAPAFLHPDDPINSTFQVGDGDHIAVLTGILTISDFRQKHIAAGGEGAPLAVYGDYLILSHPKENRILLNIGGIANFTCLPAGRNAAKVFVTDTGPGNTLIDQTIRNNFQGEYFDADSARAIQGRVNADLLTALKADSFFSMPLPKTTGPELFNLEYVRRAQQRSNTSSLSTYDLLATLTRFSAETIAEPILSTIGRNKYEIYLSGGGAHNPLMVKWIKELLGVPVLRSTDELGIPGDAKEAILFAVLANETLCGRNLNFGKSARIPSVHMGKMSFPE
ncbi:MAG TPA: anhydro-N-acetylmuramic acid kinase [Cyclobacteriaceae bacterium]|nr:anhydro-N-acetylmuramic acid kinase [Cyclobacteriaceae bacterium]